MENNSDNNAHIKTIRTMILVLVLMIPIGMAMFFLDKRVNDQREEQQKQVRINALTRIIYYGKEERNAAEKEFDRNLAREVELNVCFLKENVTEEGYTGPRILSNGFIVELQGDKVIIPEGVPEGEMQISREVIKESVASGAMRTGRIVFADTAPQGNTDAAGTSEEDPVNPGYYLSFGRITDTLIYVEMTPESEFEDYVNLYTPDSEASLKAATEMYDGITFLLRDNDGQFEQIERYGAYEGDIDLEQIGVTEEKVRDEAIFETVIGGVRYQGLILKADNEWLGWENTYVIQLLPIQDSKMDILVRVIIICLIMLLIFVTTAVYILSEQEYARENILDTEEMELHDPGKLRKKMIYASVAGTIVILCVTFLTQAVGHMYQQIRYGKDTLQLLAERYASDTQEEQEESIRQAEEAWYVSYGEDIAQYLGEKPETAVQKKLEECCEILEADFIMIFDSNGKQAVSSIGFEGFTLDRGLGENSSDFRRLLMGIPSVVHETSADPVTKLERQMIGVTMTALDDPSRYGALIMALLPDQISGKIDSDELEDKDALLLTEEVLCFGIDAEDGEVLFSGEPSMVGKNYKDCGLSEKSLQDGYMEYGRINGVDRFILTEKYEDNILYYTIDYWNLRKDSLYSCIAAAVLYLLGMVIIGAYLLKGYSTKLFREWSAQKLPLEGKADSIMNRLFSWNTLSPERKASLVFYAGLFVMMQLWMKLILGQDMGSDQYGSLFDYLMTGDWMRGFNIFSLCSILMVASIANLVITVSSWGLIVLSGFMSAKGETICILLKSMIKYITLFACLVASLSYLGFLNSTVVASLGIGTLALSLGAKDLVADILAGIFIVFEETLRVGDVVEYNGKAYTVREVGMRSAKLEIPPGNFLIVSNHEITSVTNMSKKNSICSVKIKVINQDSLVKLEEIFKRELPDISKKCELLKGPVKYFGVVEFGEGTIQHNSVPAIVVSIGAECEQKDMYNVTLFLTREIRLLAEREGIEIIGQIE